VYLLKVRERDAAFDVRDRARLLLALIESANEKIQSRLRDLLFPPRKAPNWSALDRSTNFQIGTFSQLFDKKVSGYDALPDWAPAEELPDSAVRNVAIKDKYGNVVIVSATEDVQEDDKVLDFDDFFKDEGDAEEAGEEDEAQGEAPEYYSDEGEDEAPPPKPAPKKIAPPAPADDDEEDEGDDDLDDFFN
jgi:AP-3 complex subunit beta